MSKTVPIPFNWNGETFTPFNSSALKRCQDSFVKGGTYRLEFVEGRSAASHGAYHAALNQIWKNLGEDKQHEFPSVDHLRKRALIKAGYCDREFRVFDTPEDALKAQALISARDEFAVVTVSANVVSVYTAKSQSRRAMPGKGEFESSKTAVLALCAPLIGQTTEQVMAHAKDQASDNYYERYSTEPVSQPASSKLSPDAETPAAVALEALPAPSSTSGSPPTEMREPEVGTEGAAEQKGGGGAVRATPINYDQYLAHLISWLPFANGPETIKTLYEGECKALWPTFKPRLTEFQERYFDSLVFKRVKELQ